jgi:hypothetical protein
MSSIASDRDVAGMLCEFMLFRYAVQSGVRYDANLSKSSLEEVGRRSWIMAYSSSSLLWKKVERSFDIVYSRRVGCENSVIMFEFGITVFLSLNTRLRG